MNTSIKTFLVLFLAVLVSTGLSFADAKDGAIGRKIVVFTHGLSEEQKDAVIKNSGGERVKSLDLVHAEVVNISSKAVLEKLESNSSVVRVDDDVMVEVLAKPDTGSLAAQVLPWGIDAIDAELVWPGGNTADPIKVAIIDTGISKGHPDLKNNIKGGVNTINPAKSFDDDNGHGSHVAGIVAALNNSVGVIGVAPSADLYAVKVLNRNGSGFLSDIIEGIQWAVDNKMQVINMSLGTSSNVQSMHDAVAAAKNAGIVVVAAAGNSGGSVLYPAAYPEVVAVSAVDSNSNIASWSSRGPEVDLSAPGVSVYSTYKGTGYANLSGTSMASPHVAGVSALVLHTPVGSYDVNSNGKWDPSEVQEKLQDTVNDLGLLGLDNLYGWGLVNAYHATQP